MASAVDNKPMQNVAQDSLRMDAAAAGGMDASVNAADMLPGKKPNFIDRAVNAGDAGLMALWILAPLAGAGNAIKWAGEKLGRFGAPLRAVGGAPGRLQAFIEGKTVGEIGEKISARVNAARERIPFPRRQEVVAPSVEPEVSARKVGAAGASRSGSGTTTLTAEPSIETKPTVSPGDGKKTPPKLDRVLTQAGEKAEGAMKWGPLNRLRAWKQELLLNSVSSLSTQADHAHSEAAKQIEAAAKHLEDPSLSGARFKPLRDILAEVNSVEKKNPLFSHTELPAKDTVARISQPIGSDAHLARVSSERKAVLKSANSRAEQFKNIQKKFSDELDNVKNAKDQIPLAKAERQALKAAQKAEGEALKRAQTALNGNAGFLGIGRKAGAAEHVTKSVDMLTAAEGKAATHNFRSNLTAGMKGLPEAVAKMPGKDAMQHTLYYGSQGVSAYRTLQAVRGGMGSMKAMYADITGKETPSTLQMLFGKLPPEMKDARRQYLLSAGPRAIGNIAGMAGFHVAMKSVGGGRAQFLGFGLQGLSTMAGEMVASKNSLLDTYEAVRRAQAAGQDVPAGALLALIVKASPEVREKSLDDQAVVRVAKYYAEHKVPARAIMQEVGSGKLSERLAEKPPEAPSPVAGPDVHAEASEKPAIGPHTGTELSRRGASEKTDAVKAANDIVADAAAGNAATAVISQRHETAPAAQQR